MAFTDDQLYQFLKDNKYLTDEQLENAKVTSSQEKISLYRAILEKSLITDENLGNVIADHLKMPFVALSKVVIPDEVLEMIPEEVARKNKIIAFEKTDTGLKIATSNPDNSEMLEFVSRQIEQKIIPHFATEKDIDSTLGLYKKDLQASFDKLIKQQVDVGSNAYFEAPITKILDMLVDYAYYHKASDIHIEPRKTYSTIRFRIDGVLHKVLQFEKELHEQIITRIKVLSDLRTDEHLSAQDGKMQIEIEGEELDVRVSTIPIVQGEKAVLRLLSSRSRQLALSDLGLSETQLEKLQRNYGKPYGMILVTGPTGSGKTTTIYSILKILNTPDKNIASIEDPVEYEIEGVNQIHVNAKTNLTFAHGLRSILRQDPNIIFVGEIRDEETADIAVNASMTGHLVVSTLHTNDSATTIPRLLDMKIEPFLISSTVTVIVAQRLVRTICPKCKVSLMVKKEELLKNFPANLIEQFFSTKKEVRVYHGKGCPICNHTGYYGRIGIFEVLEITQPIKELINQKADASVIRQKAIEGGMTTMLVDGLNKVQQAVTTLEEVLRATKE